MKVKPILCQKCGFLSSNFFESNHQQYFFCDTCQESFPFYHNSCPVCNEVTVLYKKPKQTNTNYSKNVLINSVLPRVGVP